MSIYIPNAGGAGGVNNYIWDTGTLAWVAQTASAGGAGDASAANQTTEIARLTSILADVDKIPSQGQALAGASTPVVLTAAQITTLTPPPAITGFATEAGHLAAIDTSTAKIPALGQALAAASVPMVMTAAQIAAITPDVALSTRLKPADTLVGVTTVATVTNLAQEGGVAVSLNTGVRDAGTRRVTIATNDLVPISAAALPLPSGAATEATLDARTGSLTEAAPASDTASSGLNGRLQRIAQNLTTLIARFMTAGSPAESAVNPSTTGVVSYPMLWNGVSWDRYHGNWRTTTGDTGAKTVTFSGASQINYETRGAMIVILLGTVSGTTPTLSAQLQVSFDGVTWINIGPALANLTTTAQTGMIYVYPANISQAAGTTPANLTNGATVSMFLNFSLPRNWRLSYTIGGTTPSFAITSVNVSYLI